MIIDEHLIDRIYEAASISELWPGVLELTSRLIGADAGALVAFSHREILGTLTTEGYRSAYESYMPVSAALPK